MVQDLPPVPAQTVAAPLPGQNDADIRVPQVAFGLAIASGLDWSDLFVWLSALIHARGHEIVRVKGVVRSPAGRLLVQSVHRVVQQPEILPDTADGRADDVLVFIGRGFAGADLARSVRGFLGRGLEPFAPAYTAQTGGGAKAQ